MDSDKKDSTSVPLKDRTDEIRELARQAVRSAHDQLGTELKNLSKEADEYLMSFEWAEDNRGLEFAIKKACILSEGPQIEVEDFDMKHRQARSIGKFVESRLKGFMRNIKRFESFNLYDMVIPEVEKSLILMVLKETNNNQIKTAKLLGINRNTLRTKLTKFGIKLKAGKK